MQIIWLYRFYRCNGLLKAKYWMSDGSKGRIEFDERGNIRSLAGINTCMASKCIRSIKANLQALYSIMPLPIYSKISTV